MITRTAPWPQSRPVPARHAGLNVVLSLAVVAGLFAWARMTFLALNLYIHAFGHTEHELSLLGQVFGDCSPLPERLPGLLVVTLLVVLTTECGVRGGMSKCRPGELVPLVLAVSMSIVLAPLVALWMTDFMQHPWYFTARTAVPVSFFEIVLLSCLGCATGALFCATYHCTRNPIVARAFPFVPACAYLALVCVAIAMDLQRFEWFYPVLFAVVVVLLASLSLAWADRMAGLDADAPHLARFAAGMAAYVLLSWLCIDLLRPCYHMCLREYGDVPRVAMRLTTMAFVGLWGVIVLAQFARRTWTRGAQSRLGPGSHPYGTGLQTVGGVRERHLKFLALLLAVPSAALVYATGQPVSPTTLPGSQVAPGIGRKLEHRSPGAPFGPRGARFVSGRPCDVRGIRLGMSEEQVVEALGKTHSRHDSAGVTTWRMASWSEETVRVTFTPAGRVAAVEGDEVKQEGRRIAARGMTVCMLLEHLGMPVARGKRQLAFRLGGVTVRTRVASHRDGWNRDSVERVTLEETPGDTAGAR